jgi:HD superfamily phosphohydrolase
MPKTCLSPEEIPRLHTGLIRDPIYHYITYSRNKGDLLGEEVLLQSRWVKRLGRLHQNQGTFAAYPGAVHTRLQHSLGVMHLAGKFVEECYPRFYNTHKGKHARGALRKPEYVIQTTRIAGLLHDICHGPFSHLFDREVLKGHNDTNHEKLSEVLINGELKSIIESIRLSWEGKEIKSKIHARDVNDILHPKPENEFWKKPISDVFHGTYSADNLDYLVRDSHYAGTPEYGTVDAERLIQRSAFHEGGIAIEEKSLSSFKSFLLSRMFMYQNVYYHRMVRAFEIPLGEILKEVANIMGLFSEEEKLNWDVYYTLDDNFILSLCYHWINTPDSDPLAAQKRKVGEKIKALTSVDGEPPLVQAYAKSKEIKSYPLDVNEFKTSILNPDHALPLIKNKLTEQGKSELHKHIRLDSPKTYILKGDPATMKDILWVYNERGNFENKSISEKLSGVPREVVCLGIYCPPEHKADVKAACRSLWEENDNQDSKGYGDTAT